MTRIVYPKVAGKRLQSVIRPPTVSIFLFVYILHCVFDIMVCISLQIEVNTYFSSTRHLGLFLDSYYVKEYYIP